MGLTCGWADGTAVLGSAGGACPWPEGDWECRVRARPSVQFRPRAPVPILREALGIGGRGAGPAPPEQAPGAGSAPRSF